MTNQINHYSSPQHALNAVVAKPWPTAVWFAYSCAAAAILFRLTAEFIMSSRANEAELAAVIPYIWIGFLIAVTFALLAAGVSVVCIVNPSTRLTGIVALVANVVALVLLG